MNKMMNRLLNNKSFTPFPHGARGETFLSRFILYPLSATSATRGTLGDMALFMKSLIIKKFILILFLLPILSCSKKSDISHLEPFNKYIDQVVELKVDSYLLKCTREHSDYEFISHKLCRQSICPVERTLPKGSTVKIKQVILLDKVSLGKTIYAFGQVDYDKPVPIFFEYYWSYSSDGLGRALWEDESTPKRRLVDLE